MAPAVGIVGTAGRALVYSRVGPHCVYDRDGEVAGSGIRRGRAAGWSGSMASTGGHRIQFDFPNNHQLQLNEAPARWTVLA